MIDVVYNYDFNETYKENKMEIIEQPMGIKIPYCAPLTSTNVKSLEPKNCIMELFVPYTGQLLEESIPVRILRTDGCIVYCTFNRRKKIYEEYITEGIEDKSLRKPIDKDEITKIYYPDLMECMEVLFRKGLIKIYTATSHEVTHFQRDRTDPGRFIGIVAGLFKELNIETKKVEKLDALVSWTWTGVPSCFETGTELLGEEIHFYTLKCKFKR